MATQLFKNLKEVKIGDVQVDGTMPATLTKIGIVTDAGVTVNEEDQSIEDLKEAGNPNPIGQNAAPGKVSFTFQMMVTAASDILNVKGGTVASNTWTPGTTFSLKENAVLISTPTTNMAIKIPRASIVGKLSGTLADQGQMLLDVTVTPLDPGVTGISSYSVVFA